MNGSYGQDNSEVVSDEKNPLKAFLFHSDRDAHAVILRMQPGPKHCYSGD